MSNQEKIIVESGDKLLHFRLSTQFYTEESAKAAAYKFTDKYYVSIEPDTDEFICVKIQPKNPINTPDLSIIASEFKNEILDQQIRIDLETRYGTLRETIIECAFRPIDSVGSKKRS